MVDDLGGARDRYLFPTTVGVRGIGHQDFRFLAVRGKEPDKADLPLAVDLLQAVAQRVADMAIDTAR